MCFVAGIVTLDIVTTGLKCLWRQSETGLLEVFLLVFILVFFDGSKCVLAHGNLIVSAILVIVVEIYMYTV